MSKDVVETEHCTFDVSPEEMERLANSDNPCADIAQAILNVSKDGRGVTVGSGSDGAAGAASAD